MSQEHDTAEPVESHGAENKLTAVGGMVGAVIGSRRGKLGAIIGGLVGATVGHFAGLRFSRGAATVPPESEPVSIDVADPAETEDTGSDTESGTEVTADDESINEDDE